MGWLKRYPINPITIVAVVVILGIIIIISNVKTRKKMAEENELVVYAEWAESIRKLLKTKPRKINITLDYEKIYTLYYVIELDRYLFCEGDKYEGKDWKKMIEDGKIVG